MFLKISKIQGTEMAKLSTFCQFLLGKKLHHEFSRAILNIVQLHCLNKLGEIVMDREAWRAAIHGVRPDLLTEQQQQ